MPLGVLEARRPGAFLWLCGRGRAIPGPYSARDGAFGWASGVVRPRVTRVVYSRCCRCEHLLRAKESHDAFGRVGSTHVLERFCAVVLGVGVPLRARTVLEMVHLDGRVGWRARELCALSEVLLQASFVCKGIP